MNSTRTKTIIKALFQTALKSANPYALTLETVSRTGDTLIIDKTKRDLSQYKNIYVIGTGKAAAKMALAMEHILGQAITKGIVSVTYGSAQGVALKKIQIIEAGHPIPDGNSLISARRIKALLKQTTKDDLVIFLISGGGSSSMVSPALGITLNDLRRTFKLLLKSGASIEEINCVRKHLDMTKGGLLAQDAWPSTMISLIISDVVGNRFDAISSGPTVPDLSTFRDALKILKTYKTWDGMPQSIRTRIRMGVAHKLTETPKKGNLAFKNTRTLLIGSNDIILKAIAQKIKSIGLKCVLRKDSIVGEARQSAKDYAREITKKAKSLTKPIFFISGGETTVTVRGNGKGGRNQEFALAFVLQMAKLGITNYVCLSCATDGIDYIKEAAGALVDGTSLSKARKLGLDPQALLENNDSYRFQKAAKTLIRTGPTGTNLNDVQIVGIY